MSEEIDAVESGGDTLGRLTRALVAQAFVLDEMFYGAAREAFSTEDISYYHARKALKAQARCRATFKVLLALRRKIPNFLADRHQGVVRKGFRRSATLMFAGPIQTCRQDSSIGMRDCRVGVCIRCTHPY